MDFTDIANLTLIEAVSNPEWVRALERLLQSSNDSERSDCLKFKLHPKDHSVCNVGRLVSNLSEICNLVSTTEEPLDNNTVIWYFAHPDYDTYSMASTAVYMCTHLGLLSLILNLFVVVALLRNHRRVLNNVFYVIVLHCAILDVVRGTCLIIYGLPSLVQSIYKAFNLVLRISTNVTLFKASSFALVILRICNLLTIFNLLVFTTNEFIVIRYPLHYRRYFRRRAVLVILACCWIVSIIMGLGLLVPPSNTHEFSDVDQPWYIDVTTLSMLMISVLCMVVLGVVMVCYSFILRTIRKFKDDNSNMNTEDSHKHNRASQHKTIHGTTSNGSTIPGGSRTRKFKLQAVQRHKYIYVIGTVLIVDLLFLCPYSGIQIVSFLHINGFLEITHSSTFIRWWLQVLIGVHSVCQPLCYFRMNEFRRLACCGGRRPWNRSKTFSQVNKSFGNTRSAIREEEEQRDGGALDEPLLECTPAVSERASPVHSWTRGESIRFRTYGNEYAIKSDQQQDIEMQNIDVQPAES